MSPNGRAYLAKLYELLHQTPEEDRLDAVREIESHIVEGIAHGQREDDILARLGDPRKLARAYRSEYLMEHRSSRSFKDVLALIGFYCTTGLLSIMVIPVLAVIAYGFGFCAILAIIAGIVRTFGATWIQMGFSPDHQLPTEWSMAFAIVVGGILGAIAFYSRKYLRAYIGFLSSRYRAVLPDNRG
ncbi:DUF1700 domain-containing protein [Paenibacillus mendelii]|uniref:DUF1700 domain-containing protein n=1 Tax=Paenibacillus mendelii TaxID=206163 RepID=A0ABV6J4Z5_9BACL|nr:DUF1700 domain-containing protein [Paenibacillus mendelii]MCQ6560443.1 DUF1700 domain-containing protein [Paenibacillus mendelii]